MPRLPLCIVASICLLSSSATQAAEQLISIIGMSNCKTWLETRPKNSEDNAPDDFGRNLNRSHDVLWLMGFMSALNGVITQNDVLKNIKWQTIEDWMDRYCIKNPKSDLYSGGTDLLNELDRLMGATTKLPNTSSPQPPAK